MLDDKDINQLTSLLATKSDFDVFKSEVKQDLKDLATKKDLDDIVANSLKIFATKKDIQDVRSDVGDLKELVQGIIISNDSIAKSIGDLTLEYATIKHQINRHEEWIKQIAEKVGLKLVAD